MNHQLPCELVRDLFPSYIDGLTSGVTNVMVEEHLSKCRACRDILESMKEPEPVVADSPEKKEIDFLKKTRTSFRNRMLCVVILTVAVLAILLMAKLFLIGSEVYGGSVACEVRVDGKHIFISGASADRRLGISDVQYTEQDGIVTLSFRAVQRNPLYQGEFQSEYEAAEDVSEVWLDQTIVWAQGEKISGRVSSVYRTRHPYVGDMTANMSTAAALEITERLGSFKNELQTDTEPCGWKLILEQDVDVSEQSRKESDMKSCAYVLLAVIDNLGEVSYDYTVNGKSCSMTVTREEATDFAGQDIKVCGQDVVLLQELMNENWR